MEKENKWLIPGAIVVAGVLIAGAMFIGGRDSDVDTPAELPGEAEVVFNEVESDDHILGNPGARIKIIEYSDIDCPFCSDFHTTMHRVIDEYGQSGEVAWVYRHFPIVQLHPDARVKSNATECVADLAGETAFWNYLDALFEREDESISNLDDIAVEMGVNQEEFSSCLEDREFDDEVQEEFEDAQRAGARGTPHSLIVVDGEFITDIQGALPFDGVKSQIDTIISQF